MSAASGQHPPQAPTRSHAFQWLLTAILVVLVGLFTLPMMADMESAGLSRAQILEMRSKDGPPQWPGFDFSGSDLSGMDLAGANLKDAVLRRCNLKGTNLAAADLRGAVLDRANLTEADLRNADLTGASLREAILVRASAAGANFSKVVAPQAQFLGAQLRGCNFSDGVFEKASFDKTDLRRTNFERANLRYVRLIEANTKGSSMVGADTWFMKQTAPSPPKAPAEPEKP